MEDVNVNVVEEIMDQDASTVETVETAKRGFGANMTPEQKEAARLKQIETMKVKWQDPIYKANVALGRHTKAVTKAENRIAELVEAISVADESARVTLETELAKTREKLVTSTAKVEETQAEIEALKASTVTE